MCVSLCTAVSPALPLKAGLTRLSFRTEGRGTAEDHTLSHTEAIRTHTHTHAHSLSALGTHKQTRTYTATTIRHTHTNKQTHTHAQNRTNSRVHPDRGDYQRRPSLGFDAQVMKLQGVQIQGTILRKTTQRRAPIPGLTLRWAPLWTGLLVVCLSMAPACSQLTQEDEGRLLKLHNHHRGQVEPSAANMLALVSHRGGRGGEDGLMEGRNRGGWKERQWDGRWERRDGGGDSLEVMHRGAKWGD